MMLNDDEGPHHKGCDRVDEEPDFSGGAVGGVAGMADVPDVFFDEVVDVILGALGEVGDFEEVGEDVVAVITEQGVGVEDDGGEAGDEHDVVAEGVGPRKLPSPACWPKPWRRWRRWRVPPTCRRRRRWRGAICCGAAQELLAST